MTRAPAGLKGWGRRRLFMTSAVAAPLLLITVLLARAAVAAATHPIPTLEPHILRTLPHSRSAFTEGLAVCGDRLVESDGLFGHSRLVVRALPGGRVLHRRLLPDSVFGEGATCMGDSLIQLTWHRGLAYYYDQQLQIIGWQHYSGQGWGLTARGNQLVLSDGSSRLHFYSARNMRLVRTLQVRAEGRPVRRLNELEWVGGRIYANVWLTDRIAVIDPHTGRVTAWIDCRHLAEVAGVGHRLGREDVLNGIAYDRAGHCLLVTGKDWPVLFEIAVPRTA